MKSVRQRCLEAEGLKVSLLFLFSVKDDEKRGFLPRQKNGSQNRKTTALKNREQAGQFKIEYVK